MTNDGVDAIVGTFSGLAQHDSVTLGSWDFGLGPVPVTTQISYTGDFASGPLTGGNDVVLYNVIPAPGTAVLLALGGLIAARRHRALCPRSDMECRPASGPGGGGCASTFQANRGHRRTRRVEF